MENNCNIIVLMSLLGLERATLTRTVIAVHATLDMVNIKGRRCQEPGCPHRPGFAIPGERRGKFCASHRLSGMVDVVR